MFSCVHLCILTLCSTAIFVLAVLHGCALNCVSGVQGFKCFFFFFLLCQEGGVNGCMGWVMDIKPDSTGNGAFS